MADCVEYDPGHSLSSQQVEREPLRILQFERQEFTMLDCVSYDPEHSPSSKILGRSRSDYKSIPLNHVLL